MIPLLLGALAMAGTPDSAQVDQVLDTLHQAATQADAATYFDLYTSDAVFVGTDPTERWDLPAFRAFAEPHFEQAPAWAYTPTEREVHFGPRGKTAWFYEQLQHERYGRVRGSGVLVRQGGDWRIAQYVLSFPIPNDKAHDVLDVVQAQRLPTLPPPFTAAHIRQAWQPGYTAEWRITQGKQTLIRHVHVLSATPEQVTLRGITLPHDEIATDAVWPESTSTWTELRDHALFPASRTTWTDDVPVTVPAGTFTTRKYVVQGDDGSRSTFWFAWDAAGPPVKMVQEQGDRVVMTMQLRSHQVIAPE